VDYTFCDLRDRPLFSIEFDGIGAGFSRAGKYAQGRTTSDPHRKLKMDFKLRLAQRVLYPLVVVSFDELEELDAEASLTILDGIVARLVTKHEESELIQRMVDDRRDEFAELSDYEAQELGQDLVLQAGVQAEMENDPLCRARWEALGEANRYGVKGSYRHQWLYDPPLPEADGVPPLGISPEVVLARAAGMRSAARVGCRATVETPLGPITREIWLRNVGQDVGLMPELIAENAALMLAFRGAAARMSEHVDRA
jgi:hypothetical protein